MDHHCPWIANCVGYQNFKFFYLACVYATLAGLYYLATEAYVIFICPAPRKVMPGFARGLYYFFLLPLISVTMLASMLTFQHTLQLFHGVTTVERIRETNWESQLFCCDWRASAESQYNMGWATNFERMLGKNLLFWLLPVGEADGVEKDTGGSDFEVIPDVRSYVVDTGELAGPEVKTGAMAKEEGKKATGEAEEYLANAEKKYPAENMVYDDLLLINNIKSLTPPNK